MSCTFTVTFTDLCTQPSVIPKKRLKISLFFKFRIINWVMQNSLKRQHLAPSPQQLLMEPSRAPLNISHISQSANSLHLLEGIKEMTGAGVRHFRTAVSCIWKEIWDCVMQLSSWTLPQKTVKLGQKSMLDSSVCTTYVNNSIVRQSITYSFSANPPFISNQVSVWSLSRQLTGTEVGQDEGLDMSPVHHRAHSDL